MNQTDYTVFYSLIICANTWAASNDPLKGLWGGLWLALAGVTLAMALWRRK